MRVSASLSLAAVALISFQTSLSVNSQTPTQPGNAPQARLAAPQVPPMGWNSWNYFAEKVTDKDIRDSADQIVSSGMKDAGYIYVNIDDTWEGERDASGVLHTNSKFPDMKALADYVHSKGLKLGIYSVARSEDLRRIRRLARPRRTGREDVRRLGHRLPQVRPVQLHPRSDAKAGAQRQGRADAPHGRRLRQDGQGAQSHRPPHRLFALPVRVGQRVGVGARLGGNLWRTTGDIEARWQSIYDILSQQKGLASYAGPGHWNDPDMLEVGNGKLSLAENRTHFSMWAMLAAPLLAGNDLPNMKPEIKHILTNREVIAINQDPLGHQARHIYSKGEVEVWTRDLKGGAKAIAIVNVGSDVYSTHPFHLDLATARPAWSPARKRPLDRQRDGPDQQHAHRTPKPRHPLVRIANPK